MKTNNTVLNRRDPDVFEVKQGGGCLTLFGLPFFLAGLFVAQIPLGIFPVSPDGDAGLFIMTIPVGILFMIVGLVLMLGRSGIVIDRRMGKAVRWLGLIAPMKRTEYPLSLFRHVSLSHQRGDKNSPDTYPVRLESDDGQVKLAIVQPTDYMEARRTAEELAGFLDKPIEDTSTGDKIVREPGRLNESLRERVRRTGEDAGRLAPMPPNMKTKVEQTGDGIILNIPSPSIGLFRYLPAFIALGFAAIIANSFLREPMELPGPPAIRYGVIIFIGFFFVLLPLLSSLFHLRKKSGSQMKVTATRAMLRVEEIIGNKIKTTEIPIEELEELHTPTQRSLLESIEVPGKGTRKTPVLGNMGTPRMPDGRPVPHILLSLLKYSGSPGITARSDKAMVTFGKGLPEEEIAYLYALIKNALLK